MAILPNPGLLSRGISPILMRAVSIGFAPADQAARVAHQIVQKAVGAQLTAFCAFIIRDRLCLILSL